MTGSMISQPEFSLPHAHLCERAMPSALGSDLEAGRFHRTVSGSGMVMSPTQALESSISRVSHHAPHVSVRRGHIGPLRTQGVRDPGSSGIRETGNAPACFGAPWPRAHALRVSRMVSSIWWDLVPPRRTNSWTAMSTYAMVDRKPAARRVAAPVIMLSGVMWNGSWIPDSLMILLQSARRACRGRVELEEYVRSCNSALAWPSSPGSDAICRATRWSPRV
jgi:hypothetical protein